MERGVRPIGLWSMSTTLSRCCRPSKLSWAEASSEVAPFSAVAVMGNRVLLIRVDLPEPETPVTQVSRPTGTSRLTCCRLLPRAPLSLSDFFLSRGVRWAGTWIFTRPERYFPVSESGCAITWSGVPSATIWPPCTPAPGPISTT
ncbi:hypothetical protein D3C84_889960 [compost metagenome]